MNATGLGLSCIDLAIRDCGRTGEDIIKTAERIKAFVIGEPPKSPAPRIREALAELEHPKGVDTDAYSKSA